MNHIQIHDSAFALVLKCDEFQSLRQFVSEPVGIGDFILEKVLHCEHSPNSARASHSHMIQGSKCLTLEGFHK